MTDRRWLLVGAVLLGLLAVPAFGVDDGRATTCGGTDAAVENVTTRAVSDVTATGATVEARAILSEFDEEVTAWFEYRVAGADVDWRETNRTDALVDACNRASSEVTLRGLEPNTTYEYRAVVATSSDSARGEVKRFRTNGTAGTSTPTVAGTSTPTVVATATQATASPTATETPKPTPYPCPTYRGVGALCEPTTVPPDDTGDGAATADWLAGLLPLVAWVGAAVVLAPLVLGGLLGLDSLRGRR